MRPFAIALATLWPLATAPGADARTSPLAWLALDAGTLARVDIAPWLVTDEPEAALTESAASLEHDFTENGQRPGDVVYEPIGVRVRIERVLPKAHLALVHGLTIRFQAYAPISRLVPEIPPGTRLRAAGGFQGFSDFFATRDTPFRQAGRLPTGSRLVALSTGTAPYDPDTADLVRVQVRVISGPLRGRIGWVAVAYTGIPVAIPPAKAAVAEKECRCRLVQFGSATEAPITKP